MKKELMKTFEKVLKKHKGKKVGVKAIILKVDDEEIIYNVEGCPPSGCPLCPPLPPEACE